jgi:hypothetical protein
VVILTLAIQGMPARGPDGRFANREKFDAGAKLDKFRD